MLFRFWPDLVLPVRWSYDGDMFRRERPQKGRWRQFRQIGAELFTGTSPEQRAAGKKNKTNRESRNMLMKLLRRCGVDFDGETSAF